MPKKHKPRFGSLQFWPRKRAKKVLPSVNWKPLEKKEKEGGRKEEEKKIGLLGFIGYKVGMLSAIVKDLTPDSMTRNKKIVLPTTVIECPGMKVLAIRFYKDNKVAVDVLASGLEKYLQRKIRLPKKEQKIKIEDITSKLNEYSNIRLIVYTLVKHTGIKKTPDIAEIGLCGTLQEKFDLAKNLLGKEIKIEDIFDKGQLIDIHGITKGKGIVGPVKRFGISLKQHKTEKGIRRPGSLGPWTPKKVSFRAPMAGQLGFFTRTNYNNKILDISKISEKNINPSSGFSHYGIIRTSYAIIKGSVQGARKNPLILTYPLRPRREKVKENFELLRLE